MTFLPPRNPRGSRRRPVLRHHLEDAFDRELDRIHGSGRSRARDRARRSQQYERRAARLVAAFVERELDDERLGELHFVDLRMHSGGALLTVIVDGDPDVPPDALHALGAALRAELCLHLPRRHTPEVRVSVEPIDGGVE